MAHNREPENAAGQDRPLTLGDGNKARCVECGFTVWTLAQLPHICLAWVNASDRRCAECNRRLSMVDGNLCEVCRDAL